MFTPIDRYEEFKADTINTRLAQLEARLLTTRDPSEIITEAALAASTETISIDVATSAYAMLHLTAALTVNGLGPVLRFNYDTTGSYGWGHFRVYSANWAGTAGAPSPNPTMIPLSRAGGAETVTTCNIDLWITFAPTTAFHQTLVLGEGVAISADTAVYTVGGSYRYRPASIQLTFNTTGSGYIYDVGSTYRLEGVRA
jgi:hypothetical protein